jgi:hypothetical protein
MRVAEPTVGLADDHDEGAGVGRGAVREVVGVATELLRPADLTVGRELDGERVDAAGMLGPLECPTGVTRDENVAERVHGDAERQVIRAAAELLGPHVCTVGV